MYIQHSATIFQETIKIHLYIKATCLDIKETWRTTFVFYFGFEILNSELINDTSYIQKL